MGGSDAAKKVRPRAWGHLRNPDEEPIPIGDPEEDEGLDDDEDDDDDGDYEDDDDL